MRLDLFKRFPFGWSININIVGPQKPEPLRQLTIEEADELGIPLTCSDCDRNHRTLVAFAVAEDGVFCPRCGGYAPETETRKGNKNANTKEVSD